MFLPPAPKRYNQDNENQARKLIRTEIEALLARVKTLEDAPTPAPQPTNPPTASFTWSNSGLTATFTDRSSDVPPGTVTSWQWDFGDGATSTVRHPSHVYQTAGTFTVTLTVRDNENNLSQPFTQQVTVTQGLRMFFAAQNLPFSEYGKEPWPDTFLTMTNGANIVNAGGYIDQARAAGARFYVRPFANSQITDPKDPNLSQLAAFGPYNLQLNKNVMNDWIAEVRSVNRTVNGVLKNGEDILREAVRDKVLVFLYTMDDWTSTTGENAMQRIPTFEDLEGYPTGVLGIHQHIKAIWPWMPIVARARNSYMKTLATKNGVVRRYRYTDGAWAQYRHDLDIQPASTFATNEVADGVSCGLGWIGGINMLNGGDWIVGTHPITGATTQLNGNPMRIHADAAWRAPRVGETLAQYDARMNPDTPQTATRNMLFGFSPNEITTTVGGAFVAKAENFGFPMWSYNFNPEYFNHAEIKPAIQTLFNQAKLRNDGPLNIRGDLPPA